MTPEQLKQLGIILYNQDGKIGVATLGINGFSSGAYGPLGNTTGMEGIDPNTLPTFQQAVSLYGIDPSRSMGVVPGMTIDTLIKSAESSVKATFDRQQQELQAAQYNATTPGASTAEQQQALGVTSAPTGTPDPNLFSVPAGSAGSTNPLGGNNAPTGGTVSGTGETGGQVFRDQNDNFFLNGQPIDLRRFKELGINADFVPKGATVSLSQAVTGQVDSTTNIPSQEEQLNNLKALGLSDATIQALGSQGSAQFAAIGEALKSMYEQNYPVPQTFTDADLERIFKQASEDPNINEFYKNQLKIGQEELRRNLAYIQGDWQTLEKQQQNQMTDAQKKLAELHASQGTVFSGFRVQAQKRLQEENQGLVESSRRTLQKELDTLGTNQEKMFGTQNLQPLSVGGISYGPITGISGQLEQNRLLDIRGKEQELINKESLMRGLVT